MQTFLSTHLFVRHRLTTIWLERAWDAGFAAVEIFCAKQHIDYNNKAQIAELGHWFRDSELKVNSVHASMYTDEVWGRSGPQSVISITETRKAKRMACVEEIKRAIEIADIVPFRYLILHIGVAGEEYADEKFDAAFSSLEELKVFSGQRGVEILLENTPNRLSSGQRLNYFLGQTHLNLNYCFDIGHAHMGGGVDIEFHAMKNRIRSVHIHDNDGQNDLHLLPSEGTIDWSAAAKLLTSCPDQFPLVLELKEPPGIDQPVTAAKTALQTLKQYI